MKRRSVYAAAMLAVAYVAFSAGELYARPKSNGGCSSCGVPSAAYSGGSASTIVVSTSTGVYRQTCVNGQCTRVKVDPSELRWEQHPDDADSLTLYCGDVQVGSMRVSAGQYFSRTNGVFASDPSDPPIAPPAGQLQPIGATIEEDPIKAADGRPLFFGVDANKISPQKCYSINGQKVSKEQAFEALGAGDTGEIPDDCDKLSFSVMGAKEVRENVRAALQGSPKLAALRPYLVEQLYDPADPMVSKIGLISPITVQDKEGTVLCRSDDTSPAAIEEAITTGLRKKRPDYDPTKDTKVGDGFSLDNLFKQLAGEKLFGWIVAGLLVVLGLKGKS